MTISDIEWLESRSVTNASRMKVVLFLSDKPRIMSHVAETCRMSTAAITGLADGMEKSGIVTRQRSGLDRRTIWLELTDKGREALKAIKSL